MEAIVRVGTAPFPPVVVFYDGADYWLADGFHRVAAMRAWADQHTPGGARQATIAAEVRQGTRRDAILYACGTNATHGLQRTQSDKRRAVETLLRDPEWRQWSDREIGRRCAVDHKTVARVRQEIAPDWGIPQSEVRQGADGRAINIAPIAAANIARSQPVADPEERWGAPVGLPAATPAALAPATHGAEVGQPPTSPTIDAPAIAAPTIWEQRRHTPIVPDILLFDEQRHPYRLPDAQQLPVRYGTPTTVRVELAGQSVTKQQAQVWCIPDDAAWERLVEVHQAFQAALDTLAGALRTLGSYPQRLKEAGGMKQAPNPLAPTVILAQDPDDVGRWWSQLGRVPLIRRFTVAQHTPQMLRLVESMATICAQRDHFVCPTDADWERVQAAHQAAEDARRAFERALTELGTYDQALHDGRYQQEPPAPVAPAPVLQPEEIAPAPSTANASDWKHAARQAEAALWNSYQHDDRAAARAAALKLLAALVEPHELVLPPFPAGDRAGLVAEIRDWMEALDEHTPQIGRFLRAVARCIV
jgi:hypothetical protein